MLVSWKLLCAMDLDTDDYYEEVKVVKWTLSQHLITNLFREPLCILESSVNNLLYSDRVTLVTVASIALSRFTVRIFIQTEMNEIQLVKVQTSRSKSWQLLTRTFLSQQHTKFETVTYFFLRNILSLWNVDVERKNGTTNTGIVLPDWDLLWLVIKLVNNNN